MSSHKMANINRNGVTHFSITNATSFEHKLCLTPLNKHHKNKFPHMVYFKSSFWTVERAFGAKWKFKIINLHKHDKNTICACEIIIFWNSHINMLHKYGNN